MATLMACVLTMAGVLGTCFAGMHWAPVVNNEVPGNSVSSTFGAYYARLVRPSDTIPGVYSTLLRSFHGAFNQEAISSTENIEALVYEPSSGATMEWADGVNGVPDWAVIGGYTSSGDPLYCARHTSLLVYGGLYDTKKDCMEYAGLAGYECKTTWEILTFKHGLVLTAVLLGYGGCSSEGANLAPLEDYMGIMDEDHVTCVPLTSILNTIRLDIEMTREEPDLPSGNLTFDIIVAGNIADEGLYWFVYSPMPGQSEIYQECDEIESWAEPAQRTRHRVLCGCEHACDRVFIRFDQYIVRAVPEAVYLCEVELTPNVVELSTEGGLI